MKLTSVCGVAFAMALGCGSSGSGIDRSRTLGSLSTAEQMSECEDFASMYPKKSVSCGTDGSASVGTDASECMGSNFEAIPSTCTVTVGQLEDCDAALYNEGSAVCSGNVPTECAPLFSAGSACN